MLFEHSNAPANFQGYINKILAKKLDIPLLYALIIFWFILKIQASHTWRLYAGFLISSGNTGFCQPEEMSIWPGWSPIPWIRGLCTESTNRGWENWNSENLTRATDSMRHLSFYMLCQFLLMLHRIK